MDLINLLAHRRNSTVTVNGHTYAIDHDGVVRSVTAVDADKLLLNLEAWRRWNGQPPAKPARPNGGIALIGHDGQPIAKPTAPLEPVATAPTPEPEPTAEPVEKSDTPEWAVPADGDWPEPVDAMPISYLRGMADAYDVSYSKLTSKKQIIKKITAAMYPEGK